MKHIPLVFSRAWTILNGGEEAQKAKIHTHCLVYHFAPELFVQCVHLEYDSVAMCMRMCG